MSCKRDKRNTKKWWIMTLKYINKTGNPVDNRPSTN